MAGVESELQELSSVCDSVAEYFCEDPSQFKLEECCSIFNSFCERFMRAIEVSLFGGSQRFSQGKQANSSRLTRYLCVLLQENRAREVAEVKRRQRDRLQIAAKRRSTATCSSRDKEMDDVALESILQNFVTSRVSRRRLGRPSSNQGSPTGGSPNSGSLLEITSQANLPTESKNSGKSLRVKEMCRNEWNSAVDLTENSKQKDVLVTIKENKAKDNVSHGEDLKTLRKEDSSSFTHPANRTSSSSSSGRTFSLAEDGEEDLEDNNEEEARKLREVSKKVLRYQNSRGSMSSADYSVENQKSPGATKTLPRQRTVDEDDLQNLDEPSNEDLVQMPDLSTKSGFVCRRHTLNLPAKVPANEKEQDNVWDLHPGKTLNPALRDAGASPSDGAGHYPTKQVLDSADHSKNFNKNGTRDQTFPSAEKKSKSNVFVTLVPSGELGEQEQEGTTAEPSSTNSQRQDQTIPPRSPWIKTESFGFFSFLRRLGDMSRLPTSKDSAHGGTGSFV